MKKVIEVEAPSMPNFIGIRTEAKPRQEGFKPNMLDIADLTPEEAEEYAELMRITFLAHYDKRRKNRLTTSKTP